MLTEVLIPALLLGLAGSAHCIAMCGGIVTALSMTQRSRSFRRSMFFALKYNIGRLLCYTTLGFIAGLVGAIFAHTGLMTVMRIFAAILLILTGLYIANIAPTLIKVEKLGQGVWRKISPLVKSLNPSRSFVHSILCGFLWGLIPCGLVYSALAVAITYAKLVESLLFMLFFGLGTLTPLLFLGIGFSSLTHWLKNARVKYVMGFSLVAFGCWSMWSIYQHSSTHSNHDSDHSHHSFRLEPLPLQPRV